METWADQTKTFNELITKDCKIVEVGSWEGASAITMAQIARSKGLKCEILCIDTWLGSIEHFPLTKDVYRKFIENTEDYPEISSYRNTSSIGAAFLEKNGIKAELVYIDGSHEERDVFMDLFAYWPICTGTMFGDDYNWDGVKAAVDKFCKHINKKPVIDGVVWKIECTGI